MANLKRSPRGKTHHVALSFAGEDRQYVERVANALYAQGVKVFYDKYEEENLWGKNLYDHLSNVYRNEAEYTVMFISKHYAEKIWPRLERQSAQSRALEENQEYILPARFDDTEVPGLLPSVGFIDLRRKTPQEFADNIVRKLTGVGIVLVRPSLTPDTTDSPQAIAVRQAAHQDLADRVIALTSKLRPLEDEYNHVSNRWLIDSRVRMSEEEESRLWDSRMQASEEARQKRERTFRREYLGEARALREELGSTLRALSIYQFDDQGTAYISAEMIESTLRNGGLAGPNPLFELSEYLESLARKLPGVALRKPQRLYAEESDDFDEYVKTAMINFDAIDAPPSTQS